MPAPLQFQCNGNQRIAVAEGADIRENNAQFEVPEPFDSIYEGN
jgi:hypothetical protein